MPTLVRTTDEPRRYLLDGAELPGVTDILTDAGYIDKSRYESFGQDGYYRDRGQYIHEACDLLDQHKSILSDPEFIASIEGYHGYVYAYAGAKASGDAPIPIAIERSLYSTELLYAGTLDREYAAAIGDLKTAKQSAAWWRLQLVAYSLLIGPPYRRLFDLQLFADGSWRVIELTREQYLFAAWFFLSALTEYHRKRKRPAKDMRALATAAAHHLCALSAQLYAEETGRETAAQDRRILAGRSGESASGPTGGNAERSPAGDKESVARSDQGDRSGRNQRARTRGVRQQRSRRRKVPNPDLVRQGSVGEARREQGRQEADAAAR